MPVSATVDMVGVKNTINALRKIDPQLQKDFKAQAIQIASPAISAAKAVYTQVPLSGMAYSWTSNGRKVFPFVVSKAVNGVRMRFDTRRNAVGVILIEQKDPAAAIFETAGRANSNRLSNSLEPVSAGRTRLIGPAVYRARKRIETEMVRMIKDTMRVVQQDL